MLAADATNAEVVARAPHPMLAAATHLSGLDRRLGFRAIDNAAELTDGTWVSLAEAATPERVTEWLDGAANGMRSVAGARVGLSFACAVVRPLMGVLHLTRRVPVISPQSTYVRTDAGLFTELAVRTGQVYCLRSDTDAGHPAMCRAADIDELLEHSARNLYWTLAPVLSTVRAKGRYGMPHLWGGVLDMIGATSLLAARVGGLPQQRAWRRAAQLCDLVFERSEQRTVRYPTPFSISHETGDMMFTVKGTCCLRYREHGLRAGEQDEQGTAYCKTCPFLGEEARLQRCAGTAERDLRVNSGHSPCAYLPYS